MPTVRVQVYWRDRLVKVIDRPLHVDGEERTVRYRRKMYRLDPGDRIQTDPDYRSGERPQRPSARMTTPQVRDAPQRSGTLEAASSSRPVSRRLDLPTDWSAAQREVIEHPAAGRLIVTAPPGTGKTATACARIAWLIEHGGVEAHGIWMISFTRAAVEELRSRISRYLTEPGRAYAVRIQTVDSLAWLINAGFNEERVALPGYEENIRSAVEKLRMDPLVRGEIAELGHLLVDEAQDLLALRSDFVMSLIGHLPATAGVTVLGDEHQAIYGFSMETDGEEHSGTNLLACLGHKKVPSFAQRKLTEIYRTSNPRLIRIVKECRALLDQGGGDRELTKRASSLVRDLADGESPNLTAESGPDDVFLYRRRVDVLNTAFADGAPLARVRLNGMPLVIAPWIGACLHDWLKPRLTSAQFDNIWQARSTLPSLRGVDPTLAWGQLLSVGGDRHGHVEMDRLRRRLSRAGLPTGVASPVIGASGPLLSTIHAFKGREAARVHLFAPRSSRPGNDDREEARVVYVGATRATETLLVGIAYTLPASGLASGRVFRGRRDRRAARVEIGRDNDIGPEDVVGRSVWSGREEAAAIQERLAHLDVSTRVPVDAHYSHERGRRMIIKAPGTSLGESYGALSLRAGRELFLVATAVGGQAAKPGPGLNTMAIYGSRTIALPHGDPRLQDLHDPWSESGIALAPVILGFAWNNFRYV